MDYTALSKRERALIVDLAELALGGDKDARENLESITGINFATAGDIYRVMTDTQKSMTKSELSEDYNNAMQRSCGPVPTKPRGDWGGAREGSGRPSTGRKKKSFYITDEENEALRKHLEELRNGGSQNGL